MAKHPTVCLKPTQVNPFLLQNNKLELDDETKELVRDKTPQVIFFWSSNFFDGKMIG